MAEPTTETLEYLPTPCGAIGQTVERLFQGVADSDTGLAAARQRSMLVLVPEPSRLAETEAMVSELALVHPGRFFLICVDSNVQGVRAEVSGRCHWISESQKVCCEVIRLTSAPTAVGAVASIVRSHLHTGLPVELFLGRQQPIDDFVQALIPLVDLVVLDSRGYRPTLNVLKPFLDAKVGLADWQWVALGMWRDQIKVTFDQPVVKQLADSIRELEVVAETKTAGEVVPAALLLAGWLGQSLEWEARSVDRNGFECIASDGSSRRIKLSADAGADQGRIKSVRFRAKGLATGDADIAIVRGDKLETTVEGAFDFRMSRNLEDESAAGLFRRYFAVGDSVVNYRRALQAALELEALRAGFAR